MKKKIIIVVVLIILIGVISYFVYSVKKDRQMVLDNMEKVNTYYEKFYKSSSKINEIRENYSNIITDIYYEKLNEKNEEIISILNDYKKEKEDIKILSEKLDTLCKNYYSDNNINQKCQSYTVTMESINKYYDLDVDGYNNIIDKYNENAESKIEKFNK